VPGDVLHLEEGRVPTDCMLLSAGDASDVDDEFTSGSSVSTKTKLN
jgi:hypothetical protein